ncbi:hypothetical protein [Kineobactrum salinum]|uniref:Uncharacterized protein n=1 Tax=Kineobactrum salinum TaxID=2708301 RepID=A0A6C0TXJ0_9GAMM|nr:hypothetical protein [Kineobactrum salinum]QIB64119.1 hypothetical protein G3T16_00490 [Kineobactrum salinum]
MKWLSFELDGARLYGFVKGEYVVNIHAINVEIDDAAATEGGLCGIEEHRHEYAYSE